jgi:hypothetical protein
MSRGAGRHETTLDPGVVQVDEVIPLESSEAWAVEKKKNVPAFLTNSGNLRGRDPFGVRRPAVGEQSYVAVFPCIYIGAPVDVRRLQRLRRDERDGRAIG